MSPTERIIYQLKQFPYIDEKSFKAYAADAAAYVIEVRRKHAAPGEKMLGIDELEKAIRIMAENPYVYNNPLRYLWQTAKPVFVNGACTISPANLTDEQRKDRRQQAAPTYQLPECLAKRHGAAWEWYESHPAKASIRDEIFAQLRSNMYNVFTPSEQHPFFAGLLASAYRQATDPQWREFINNYGTDEAVIEERREKWKATGF